MTYVKRESHFRLILRVSPAVGAVALTAAICAATARSADYAWPVTRVIDGDTVEVKVPGLPPELTHLRVRLRDVDTPETRRPKCAREKDRGQGATRYTKMRVAEARRIIVRNPKWGKYGGRVLADLILDGKSLSDELIDKGHGRPYRGGPRKTWCSGPGM